MGRIGVAITKAVEQTVEEQTWVDRVAGPVQNPIYRLMESSGTLRTILDGTWLGHPLHAAVTDLPVGSWAAGFVLDMLDVLGINRNLRRGTDALHTIGLIGALSAAIPGLADWSYTSGPARRVGFIHGLGNILIAGLYGASLVSRARGNRGTGIALSSLGYGLLLFTSWLGGELGYRFGIGVNRIAFQDGPREWVPVLDEYQLREGDLRRVEANGTPVLLTRYLGEVYAIRDTCTHMGCSLSQGEMRGDQVVCRCHGSHFRVTDGQVMVGPASNPEPPYEVRIRDGRIEVREMERIYGMASVR